MEQIRIEDITPGDEFVIPRTGFGEMRFINVTVERTTKTQVIDTVGRRWKVGNGILVEYGARYGGDIAYRKGGERHRAALDKIKKDAEVDEMLSAIRLSRYNCHDMERVKQALDVLTEWHARLVAEKKEA